MPKPQKLVTWKTILLGLGKLASMMKKIPKTDIEARSDAAAALALTVFGLQDQDIHALRVMVQDNIHWFESAQRGSGTKSFCMNPRRRSWMRSLFVLDPIADITFLTKESVIADAAGTGGLNWKRTPVVTRIRRNRVMNWGTRDTRFVPAARQAEQRVILVPHHDIADSAILMSGPILHKTLEEYSDRYRALRLQNDPAHFPIWWDIFMLAEALLPMATEHECLTFGAGVRCDVFRIDSTELEKSKWRTATAPRKPVFNA